GKILVELAVDGRAPARRHALGYDLDQGARGRAGLAQLVEILRPILDHARVRGKEGIVVDLAPRPARAVNSVRADLHQRAADRDGGDQLAGDGAGGNAHGGLARGSAPAAAIVANAVFGPVGIVCVAGPDLVLDAPIVLAALVDIVDQER